MTTPERSVQEDPHDKRFHINTLITLLAFLFPMALPGAPQIQYEGPPIRLEERIPGVTTELLPFDVTRFLPRHWDFEDGTLQGFQHADVPGGTRSEAGAFHNQPTFGDNVSTWRALNTGALTLPANPCAGLVLDEATTCEFNSGFYNLSRYLFRLRDDLNRIRGDLETVGGGYSEAPFPIGKQGLYWIGTYENRPSRQVIAGTVPGSAGAMTPRPQPWGTVQGDQRTGRLVSPVIELQQDYFHFLVGGGCTEQVGVYLQARRVVLRERRRTDGRLWTTGETVPLDPITVWETLRDNSGRPIAARGHCIENMVRVSFDIRNLRGTMARILIEDRATGGWGHINVDDIWLAADPPRPSSRDTDPVWGVADLHAHLMNEKGFTAYGPDGRTPEARALWGSALGPIENLRNCNDTHTTNDHNFSSHQDEALGSTYTLCRDACLNLLEGAGLPERPHDRVDQDGILGGYHNNLNSGYPRFVNWPLWYSSIHQQMHWSWVRRAHQGGLRLMIAAVGNSEVISFALVKEKDRGFSSDQDALALQIPAIKEFARQNSTWAEVAYTPRDARRIMNSGKLAIVIGVELDHVMDNCGANVTAEIHHRASEHAHPGPWALQTGYNLGGAGTAVGIAQFIGAATRVMHYAGHPRTCTDLQIQARLNALYLQGVRHIIPMHFSNNLLGGYAINGELFIASAIFGDPEAQPPVLMSQEELTEHFGESGARFVPVAREAYSGENRDREARWRRGRAFGYKLPEVTLPIWARLSPESIVDTTIIPPGPGRTIAEFFAGKCIQDEGWRVFFGFLTIGGSEAACAVSTLTAEAFDSARGTMPYEGATDSPAMIPLEITQQQRDLAFHVNARGLTNEGELFIREMMSRGMLIDIQHASEKAKNQILGITGAYPVMASHGGVATGFNRTNENVLSTNQLRLVYSPPEGFAGGIVGLGAQSSRDLVKQIRQIALGGLEAGAERDRLLQTRGVALGTDLNGLDWHAAPRFGRYAYYDGHLYDPPDPARERNERLRFDRDGGIGPMVNYSPYPAESNPWAATLPTCDDSECPTWSRPPAGHRPLNAHQITQDGRVTRTFDINFDGLAHYGMLPDFLQELSVLGTTSEEMGALFRSSETLIRMWEENCSLAYQMPSPPASLVRGCGDRANYLTRP